MQVQQEAWTQSVSALQARLQAGELSPEEALDACLARIERLNGDLNAFIEVTADSAREQARDSADRLVRGEGRPLEGVPIAIKDNMPVAGVPMRDGTRMSPAVAAPIDAVIVARLRAAGVVLVGKTTLPEFGTIASTESALTGATRNPWDQTRTTGGSSGGSAAAVAAGMVPAAHGNDGGGSLRIPASCCGLYSIKPSRGRSTRAPWPEMPGGLVVDGFLTHTVRDNALLLDVIRGHAPGDAYWATAPARPFVAEVEAPPRRLRIAWTATPPLPVPVDPACVAAVEAAARLCESLGHEVEEATPDWVSDDALPMFTQLWASLIGANVEFWSELGGDPALVEPHNRALHGLATAINAAEFTLTYGRLQTYARLVVQLWERFDVLLTPTLGELPLTLGTVFELTDDDPLYAFNRCAMFTPFTPILNLTGQPAASLPLHWHQGLPVGVQAIGRQGDEATLFALSAQMEAAAPWHQHRPPLD